MGWLATLGVKAELATLSTSGKNGKGAFFFFLMS